MPIGIYKHKPHSEERKRKIGLAVSIALKGKKLSEEHKNKIKLQFKINQNMGMKGKKAWNKGLTKETDNRVRILGLNSGKSRKGISPSIETRRKISESHKGKEKYWLKGKCRSEETRKKISESNKGKLKGIPRSEITKQKIKEHHAHYGIGIPRSEETKEKIRLKNIGRKIPKEVIEKMLKTKKERGIIISNETKEKIRRKLIGHKVSKETRNKISKMLKGKLSLSKNPAWLGGISFEPYDIKFNEEFKNLIRLRDNFCCLNCGISEQKHLFLLGRKLAIHHINYNKKDTCLFNCITLCLKCNILANKNRKLWEKYYQDKLKDKYGYTYDETGIKLKIKHYQIERALGMGK